MHFWCLFKEDGADRQKCQGSKKEQQITLASIQGRIPTSWLALKFAAAFDALHPVLWCFSSLFFPCNIFNHCCCVLLLFPPLCPHSSRVFIEGWVWRRGGGKRRASQQGLHSICQHRDFRRDVLKANSQTSALSANKSRSSRNVKSYLFFSRWAHLFHQRVLFRRAAAWGYFLFRGDGR